MSVSCITAVLMYIPYKHPQLHDVLLRDTSFKEEVFISFIMHLTCILKIQNDYLQVQLFHLLYNRIKQMFLQEKLVYHATQR
jgi:hypothetical protein